MSAAARRRGAVVAMAFALLAGCGDAPPARDLRVTIIDVNTTEGICTVRDQTMGRFEAWMPKRGAANQIPAVGELWSATRDYYEWKLRAKVESSPREREEMQRMSEGDSYLASTGMAHIMAPGGINLNNSGLGSTHIDEFTSDESGSYTLSAAPLHERTVEIQFGMAVLNPSEYSVDGYSLTINEDFATGIPITVRYQTVAWIYDDAATVSLGADSEASEEYIP